VTVKITGAEEFKKKLEKLRDSVSKEQAQIIMQVANLVRTDAIKSIQKVSTGELVTRYRLSGKKYKHMASKHGDAPNTDTGRLVKSVQVEIKSDGVYVGTSVEYGKFLEFGTTKVKERPWLHPALKRNKKFLKKKFLDELKKRKK
jgi:HK97 gp10 family phage protein